MHAYFSWESDYQFILFLVTCAVGVNLIKIMKYFLFSFQIRIFFCKSCIYFFLQNLRICQIGERVLFSSEVSSGCHTSTMSTSLKVVPLCHTSCSKLSSKINTSPFFQLLKIQIRQFTSRNRFRWIFRPNSTVAFKSGPSRSSIAASQITVSKTSQNWANSKNPGTVKIKCLVNFLFWLYLVIKF